MINTEERELWMTLIIHCLKGGKLPDDNKEAKKVKRQLTCFFSENEQLYKKGCTLSSLHCLHLDEANYVLREIH